MLTLTEEKALIVAAQAGSIPARDKILHEKLPFIRYYAKKYADRFTTIEDLVQEGAIGMLSAIAQYNPEKGAFAHYCSLWIKQSMRCAVYTTGRFIKVPVWTRKHISRYRTASVKLNDINDLSKALKLSITKTKAIQKANQVLAVSIEKSSYVPFEEQNPLDHLIQQEEIDLTLKQVSSLPKQEKSIIQLRFGLDGLGGRSLICTGKSLGLSKEKVRQIQKIAMHKIVQSTKKTG